MKSKNPLILSLFGITFVITAPVMAEIYRDPDGSYQLVASSGNRVTISPSRDVLFNGKKVLSCPDGYEATQLFDGGVATCDGQDISVTAGGAVFNFDGEDIGIVDAGRIENKSIAELGTRTVSVAGGSVPSVVINSGSDTVSITSSGGSQQIITELGAVKAGDDLVVDLKSDVLFEFNSAAVLPHAEETLRRVAKLVIQERKGYVAITGHTDSVGERPYNQELSERRAGAVAAWLNKNGGVSLSDMIIQGRGEDFPVALNVNEQGEDDPQGRERNRRVEIIIQTVKKDPEYLRTPRATIIDAAGMARNAARAGAAGARVGVAGAQVGLQGAAIGLEGLAEGLEAAAEGLEDAGDEMGVE